MLALEVARLDMLHLGSKEWTPSPTATIAQPGEDSCVLVWQERHASRLPDIIVIRDGTDAEFWSWVSTYVSHLSPLSGLFRVLSYSAFRREHDMSRPSDVEDMRRVRGHIGLVHAETVALCHGRLPASDMGIGPYTASMSWVAMQCMRKLIHPPSPAEIAGRWIQLRELSGANSLSYKSTHVEEVLALVDLIASQDTSWKLRGSSDPVTALVEAAAEKPQLQMLAEIEDFREALAPVQEGTVERRVAAYNQLVREVFNKNNASPTRAIITGLALSLLSQGTFDHYRLVGPDRVPDIRPLLWYGWFEFTRDELAPQLWGHATHKLLDLSQRTSPCPPLPAIALDELQVLSRAAQPYSESFIDIHNPVNVELFEGVTSFVRVDGARTRQYPRGNKSARIQQRRLDLD